MKTTSALISPSAFSLTLACLLAAGCGTSRPVQYYMLRAAPSAPANPAGEDGLLVLVGPVHIPPHLEPSPMALSTEGTEVKYSDYQRWAESLDAGILRVIRAELDLLLPDATVTPFAWVRSAPYDYRIPIYVLAFSGSPGKEAHLSAQWAITTQRGREALITRTSAFSIQPDGASVEALVRAQSELVQQLGREIAEVLRDLPPTHPEE